MASSNAFKEFVLEQLIVSCRDDGYSFRARKMFGEYMIYVMSSNEPLLKPIFLICNDILYVKQHEILKPLLESATIDIPFPKAKQWYILDIDSPSLLKEVVLTLAPTLPLPKPKNAKRKTRYPMKLSAIGYRYSNGNFLKCIKHVFFTSSIL